MFAASPLEELLFHLVNSDLGPAVDAATVLLSSYGFGLAAGVALTALILWRAGLARWPSALALPVAVTLADLIGSQLLKPLFGRVRPCYALAEGTFRWLVPAADSGALPSLHAANFAAMAAVAFGADRRLGRAAAALAVAVAFARVHGGVHWPTDVLAGAAWGALCGLVARAVAAEVEARRGRAPAPRPPA